MKKDHEIESEIKTIIAEQLGLSSREISGTKKLEDLGADSLDAVEIFMKIDEKYNLRLDDKKAGSAIKENLDTFIKYVQQELELKYRGENVR